VDQQQGGAAVRTVIPQLGNMEFGVYYYHYLSRWPMMNMPEAWPINMFVEWPEVDLVGISFSQAIQNWGLNVQVGGEITYRWNEPMQLQTINSPFIASASGMDMGVGGYERANTLSWDLNGMKMMFDIFDFTPYTFQLTPLVEFYGKLNLDYEEEMLFMDPEATAYYTVQLPLSTSDMIDNTRLDIGFSAMGGLHSQRNQLHTLGFTAGAKFGDAWEVLFGYNLAIGNAEQDPQGQFMWDRDNFVFKFTHYFI
jgi:hypothetical protein